MADFLPQASTTSQSGHGHEANTLVVKGLVVFALALIAMAVVVEFCLIYVMKDFSQEEKVLQALAPPALSGASSAFPAPRLQAEPPTDLAKLKQAELRRLNGYGWVNREAGIAHVPIDRAMDIVASRGLPVGGGPAEKKAEVTPSLQPATVAGKPAGPAAKRDRQP